MKILFFSILLCLVVPALHAQDVYQWFATDPPHTIQPTTNWLTDHAWFCEIGPTQGQHSGIPGPTDKAKINNVQWGPNWDQYSPIIGGINGTQDITIGDVFIAEGNPIYSPEHLTIAQNGTLNVFGAGGTAEGQINLSYFANSFGALIVDGGTVNVYGPVHVGWAGTGNLVINSGSLNAWAIDIGASSGNGLIEVNGGRLVIRGFAGDYFQQLVDNGQLISNGSADNVLIAYDEGRDITIVTPEPAGIALLGLGLAFFRRQK